jgi:hypothetical protein
MLLAADFCEGRRAIGSIQRSVASFFLFHAGSIQQKPASYVGAGLVDLEIEQSMDLTGILPVSEQVCDPRIQGDIDRNGAVFPPHGASELTDCTLPVR